jgi:hypothetical protein
MKNGGDPYRNVPTVCKRLVVLDEKSRCRLGDLCSVPESGRISSLQLVLSAH